MEGQYRLEMKNITKHFGGVKALTDVSLRVEPGEIHALIGENGAGKSTLMKILSGAYQRDSGQIFIDGKEVKISTPKDSKNLGVAIIYQEFMLAPDLTVAENIYIDRLSEGKAFINWKKLREDAKKQLDKLGFSDIDPNAKCGSLSVAYQQVVEICKCLTRDANVLVFDEPTAVLTFSEIEKLFEVINKLKENGVSIIYISHRLEEIFELSQHITILIRKIAAVLRRSGGPQEGEHRTITYQNLLLDFDNHTATVDGTTHELTQREFEVLKELLTQQGRILTRQNLLDKLWRYDFYGDERVVDTHIKNLRKKLGISFIQTIRGVGYKIDKEN